MSSTSIIPSLYSYLASCPVLAGQKFHWTTSSEDGNETTLAYAISADQGDEQLVVYQSGTVLIRSLYRLSSTDNCTPDMAQQLSDTGLFDQLALWMSQENAKRNLPLLPDGLTPRNIRAVGATYLYSLDNNSGEYQIQFELEYYRKVVD